MKRKVSLIILVIVLTFQLCELGNFRAFAAVRSASPSQFTVQVNTVDGSYSAATSGTQTDSSLQSKKLNENAFATINVPIEDLVASGITFNQAKIKFNRIKTYKIQYLNGSTWLDFGQEQTTSTTDQNAIITQTVTLPSPVTGAKVRVLVTSVISMGGPQIYDFQLYDTPASTNLTLNKSVTVSETYGNNANSSYAGSNAVDNDPNSCWNSNDYPPNGKQWWLAVNLVDTPTAQYQFIKSTTAPSSIPATNWNDITQAATQVDFPTAHGQYYLVVRTAGGTKQIISCPFVVDNPKLAIQVKDIDGPKYDFQTRTNGNQTDPSSLITLKGNASATINIAKEELMGSSTTFNQARIITNGSQGDFSARIGHYKIQYSNNGKTWLDAYSYTGTGVDPKLNQGDQLISFPAVTGTRARLLIDSVINKSPSTTGGPVVYELELYNSLSSSITNLTFNKPTTASESYTGNSDVVANKATDGSPGTRWAANDYNNPGPPAGKQWWLAVELNPPNTTPETAQYQFIKSQTTPDSASILAGNWTDITTVDTVVAFPKQSDQYYLVVRTARETKQVISGPFLVPSELSIKVDDTVGTPYSFTTTASGNQTDYFSPSKTLKENATATINIDPEDLYSPTSTFNQVKIITQAHDSSGNLVSTGGLNNPVGRLTNYSIQYLKQNDSTWSTAYTYDGGNTTPDPKENQLITFPTVTGTKVRLLVNSINVDRDVCPIVYELQLYYNSSPNLTLNNPLTASSVFSGDPTFGADKAGDNNLTTLWWGSRLSGAPWWLQVDLHPQPKAQYQFIKSNTNPDPSNLPATTWIDLTKEQTQVVFPTEPGQYYVAVQTANSTKQVISGPFLVQNPKLTVQVDDTVGQQYIFTTTTFGPESVTFPQPKTLTGKASVTIHVAPDEAGTTFNQAKIITKSNYDYTSRMRSYKIQYLPGDGSDWKDAYSYSGTVPDPKLNKLITFPAVTGTKARVWIGETLGGAPGIGEFELYNSFSSSPDTNLALNSSVASANAIYDTLYTAYKAIDGNPSTQWTAPDGGITASSTWYLEVGLATSIPTKYQFIKTDTDIAPTSIPESNWVSITSKDMKIPFPIEPGKYYLAVRVVRTDGTKQIVVGPFVVNNPKLKVQVDYNNGQKDYFETATFENQMNIFQDPKVLTGTASVTINVAPEELVPTGTTFNQAKIVVKNNSVDKEAGGRIKGYTIQYSNDGNTWIDAYTTTGTDDLENKLITFPAVTGMYAKLLITSVVGYAPIVSEFELYNNLNPTVNLTFGKTPVISNYTWNSEHIPDKAVDGIESTAWAGAGSVSTGPWWLQVKLGAQNTPKSQYQFIPSDTDPTATSIPENKWTNLTTADTTVAFPTGYGKYYLAVRVMRASGTKLIVAGPYWVKVPKLTVQVKDNSNTREVFTTETTGDQIQTLGLEGKLTGKSQAIITLDPKELPSQYQLIPSDTAPIFTNFPTSGWENITAGTTTIDFSTVSGTYYLLVQTKDKMKQVIVGPFVVKVPKFMIQVKDKNPIREVFSTDVTGDQPKTLGVEGKIVGKAQAIITLDAVDLEAKYQLFTIASNPVTITMTNFPTDPINSPKWETATTGDTTVTIDFPKVTGNYYLAVWTKDDMKKVIVGPFVVKIPKLTIQVKDNSGHLYKFTTETTGDQIKILNPPEKLTTDATATITIAEEELEAKYQLIESTADSITLENFTGTWTTTTTEDTTVAFQKVGKYYLAVWTADDMKKVIVGPFLIYNSSSIISNLTITSVNEKNSINIVEKGKMMAKVMFKVGDSLSIDPAQKDALTLQIAGIQSPMEVLRVQGDAGAKIGIVNGRIDFANKLAANTSVSVTVMIDMGYNFKVRGEVKDEVSLTISEIKVTLSDVTNKLTTPLPWVTGKDKLTITAVKPSGSN